MALQGICRHRRMVERRRSAHVCQFRSKSRDRDRGPRDSHALQRFYKGVIEWRLEKQQDGKARPFAAIARWNVARAADNLGKNGTVSGRVLLVTGLGPGAVCHVGYVDALANAKANDLAREIADKHARAFECGKDKPVIPGKVEPGNDITHH
jgi:hypothetical protein